MDSYSLKEYFGGKDTEAYRKYKEGQKAGKWSDLTDFISQGGTPSGNIESFVDSVLDAANIELERKFLSDYETKNPFFFDEALAKESATAEYEPYYTELLDDYLADVETKRETIEDDARLSKFLSDYSIERTGREYDRALSQAEEGFAGSGMFFSGVKKKSTGEIGIERDQDISTLEEKQAYGERATQRNLGILDTDMQRKQRDLAREQQTAMAGGIETRRGEALKGYYTPLTQSYYRQFPTSTSSSLRGYIPDEYLRY